MQTKEELVKSLKKVKLVIGNGFDLHCKLKSTYRDYFLYNGPKNTYIKNWISEFKYKARDYTNLKVGNNKGFCIDFKDFDKTNIWDFFFCLNSNISNTDPKEWYWCDIESKIQEWLYESMEPNCKSNYKNWGRFIKLYLMELLRRHKQMNYLF